MQATHSLDVSPHEVFAADGPGACKVIDVLVLAHVAQTSLPEEARPDDIPGRPGHVPETRHLERVNDTVVRVRAVRNLEARLAARWQLV